ncbi:MAG: hypothetical protein HQ498_04600 [Pseudohongiella sp.]|nr:hypothetical protein [Pseudohongiella sp.]
MNAATLIPALAIIFSLGVLPLSILYFVSKTKAKKMDTLIKVVELGGNVDAETLKMLSDGGGNHKADYKSGLIWLAIGVPLATGIWMESGIEEAVFGAIPMFVGIAFLIAGKYRLRESS